MSNATTRTPRGRDLTTKGWLGPLILVSGFVGLALMSDSHQHGLVYFLAVGWGFVGLVVAFAHFRNLDQVSKPPASSLAPASLGSAPLTLGLVLGVAVVVRVLVLLDAPSLSDDIFRYLWDGRVVVAGENPYRLAPQASELASLRDDLWPKTAHRDVPTVYPPVALAVFGIATVLPQPIIAYRVFLLVVDVLSCVLLWRLTRSLHVPRSRTLLYAWNPLVVVEGVGSGHIDLLGVSFVLLALVCLADVSRRRGPSPAIVAGLSAALGVLTKLVPLVLLPLWWIRARRSIGFLVAVLLVLVVVLLPVLLWTGGIPPGLVTYGMSWEFNGPLYEPLWRVLDVVGADDLAKSLLERVKQATGAHDELNPLFELLYPQLMAKLLLGVLLVSIVVLGARQKDLIRGTGQVLGGALLCSATLYPWYILWIVPIAALTLSPFWLVLTLSMQLAYLPRFIGVPLFPWVFLLVWLPPMVVAFVERRRGVPFLQSDQIEDPTG